ncbi:MAG: ETC complex I subunit [Alphaproteobacteria bacterium]|jgi:hypothetical protein|nr:ETC complex I subunit [Alphaproteobacteria bacterium]
MTARIYRPAKNAMQSGRANMDKWVLEYDSEDRKTVDSLMGWTGSGDTRRQVKLTFPSKEEAVAYALRTGLDAEVRAPNERQVRTKAYADNFIRKN